MCRRKTCSMQTIEAMCASQSIELGVAFFTCLSDIQQARLWLYAIEGYNTCQIAAMESIAQKNVYISIMKARKNILNFLEKGGYKTAVFATYSERAIN